MKKLQILLAAMCSVLIFTACKNKNEVKVESLTNTYWECVSNEYSYMKVWFYTDNTGKVILRSYKSDEPTTSDVGYSVKQSGYVSITLFPGTRFESEWITGMFNKDKGTLTLNNMSMTYKGKAQ